MRGRLLPEERPGGPLVAAAVLAVVIGVGVAYCQHQDDTAPQGCSGVAFAVPAHTTRPALTKPARTASGRPAAPRTSAAVKVPARPSATVTVTSRPHGVDIDLDLRGC